MNMADKPTLIKTVVVIERDPYADTSWLGEYTDDVREPWAILVETGDYIARLPDDYQIPPPGRKYRAFRPYAGGEPPGTVEYIEHGLNDFRRMEALQQGHWYHVGIYAEAIVRLLPSGRLATIRSGGLWGIESDSGDAYFHAMAEEELAQLETDLETLGIHGMRETLREEWEKR